jgi:hypothetical protein
MGRNGLGYFASRDILSHLRRIYLVAFCEPASIETDNLSAMEFNHIFPLCPLIDIYE